MYCRAPAVAGRFYPLHKQQLQHAVLTHLSQASGLSLGAVPRALIVPHAGFQYSGRVAAEAYACLLPQRDAVRQVVLLGPSHYRPLHGIALPSQQAFSTPLGEVPICQAWREIAMRYAQVEVDEEAHRREHSLEVQLPFLQCCLSDFHILPMLVGQVAPELICQVLSSLPVTGASLLVISTDLSHFLPYQEACLRDQRTARRILQFDQHIQPQQACGAYALDGGLAFCRTQGWRPQLLAYCNSGDVTADKTRVVGYASFVLS